MAEQEKIRDFILLSLLIIETTKININSGLLLDSEQIQFLNYSLEDTAYKLKKIDLNNCCFCDIDLIDQICLFPCVIRDLEFVCMLNDNLSQYACILKKYNDIGLTLYYYYKRKALLYSFKSKDNLFTYADMLQDLENLKKIKISI